MPTSLDFYTWGPTRDGSAIYHHGLQCSIYVAAKATYIRLLHGKIGFLGFFGPSTVQRGRTHIVLG